MDENRKPISTSVYTIRTNTVKIYKSNGRKRVARKATITVDMEEVNQVLATDILTDAKRLDELGYNITLEFLG